tara:strand:- start:4184 stop:6337 length:2154 start_codon:yes stop_codon:yes gene_type:complete
MNKYFILTLVSLIFLLNLEIKLNANDETYINSNNIIYDEYNNVVELSKNSKINIGPINILIDRGIIDYNQNKVEVFGNFYLYEDLNIIRGKNLKGDIKLNNLTATEVNYIYNNNLKIDSKKLVRDDDNLYLYNNFLTPCELDGFFNCPTWSLRISKTEYNLTNDQFKHYDNFLQIADYKVFYLPYLSHFGVKAPRQKGFLNPTLSFEIGGKSQIATPYYLPINNSTEMIFTPTFTISEFSNPFENFENNIAFRQKRAGGEMNLDIYTNKTNTDDVYTSAKFNTSQVINKNTIFKSNLLLTNSISTSRSINNEPITFEDVYFRFDRYDQFSKNDYASVEIASVETFDATKASLVPFTPSLSYSNYLNLKKFSNFNDVDLRILKRDESNVNSPSENFHIKVNQKFISQNHINRNLSSRFNINLQNNFYKYDFEHNQSLNKEKIRSNIIFSVDNSIQINNKIKSRLKFVHNIDLLNSELIINEDSESITFNYENQFSDSRFFGSDLVDNSSRFIYGIEGKTKLSNKNLNFKIGQSYEIYKNSNYSRNINQTTNFSDYAVEAGVSYENFNFKVNSRLDKNNFSKKEMNYSLNVDNPIKLGLIYNETDKNSFSALSDDSKNLKVNIGKNINDNISISYQSELDLKNNFSPYKDSLSLNLSDECSVLSIVYSNVRYNDNFNTTPTEKISITYFMDYLGYFGYEQSTDLFFKEVGNFNNEMHGF